MNPDTLDTIGTGLACLASVGIWVASYRRCRCLSRYSIPRSVLIAFVAGGFQALWLIVWWVNRERIADEWEMWRRERSDRDKVTT